MFDVAHSGGIKHRIEPSELQAQTGFQPTYRGIALRTGSADVYSLPPNIRLLRPLSLLSLFLSIMFEYITARILHTPFGKRVDELVSRSTPRSSEASVVLIHPSQLAKAQVIDSPGRDDSPPRSPSISNMLNDMATHSRRIQDRIPPEASRSRPIARRSNSTSPPSLPSQESIIYSLYVASVSSSNYSSIDYNHRFPRNAIRYPRRSLRRHCLPPPVYSKTDPNASISATLSEMGLSVRGDLAPRLPPPYSSLPVLPPPVDA